MAERKVAVIVGAGTGLSASLARRFAKEGFAIALASRSTDKLASLVKETGAKAYACDASDKDQVATLFANVDKDLGASEVCVYNASRRARGPITDLDPDEVKAAVLTSAYGAFLVGQAAAKRMVPTGHGTIFFTGASAGVKGFPESAPFAMGKFGLRGLAQSMARELQPKGIHVVHVVVDGPIANPGRAQMANERGPDSLLDPAAIAETYYQLYTQHRSAWSWEIEVRPWVEKF